MATGRPLTYTTELGEEICLEIATRAEGIGKLCKRNPHWPCKQTIFEWRIKIKSFGEQYTKAKAAQIECLVDEILDIADDSSNDEIINDDGKVIANSEYINRCRLRIDSRKWLASKLAPKIYGDKTESTHNVSVEECTRTVRNADDEYKKAF